MRRFLDFIRTRRRLEVLVVKSILAFIVWASGAWVCACDITNVNQCVNTDLTEAVLRRFPSNATSTAQNCVLTFIKGSVEGDLKVFASPFSAEIQRSEFGVSNLDNIPAQVRNEFSTLINSVSNCSSRVTLYSETINNGVVKANLTFRGQGVGYNRDEVVRLDISQTNNCWHIVNWDVDE